MANVVTICSRYTPQGLYPSISAQMHVGGGKQGVPALRSEAIGKYANVHDNNIQGTINEVSQESLASPESGIELVGDRRDEGGREVPLRNPITESLQAEPSRAEPKKNIRNVIREFGLFEKTKNLRDRAHGVEIVGF